MIGCDNGSDDNKEIPPAVYDEDELPDLDEDAAVAGTASGEKGREEKLWIWEKKGLRLSRRCQITR